MLKPMRHVAALPLFLLVLLLSPSHRPLAAWLLLTLAGLVSTAGSAFASETAGGNRAPSPNPPNIVFILADDLGWADLNAYHHSRQHYYETPNLDRLAAQGMRFTAAYTNGANCAPTRASLMSGQYYPRQPVYTVGSGARGEGKARRLVASENQTTLPAAKVTFAEVLQEAGYATGFLGKWHLGAPGEAGPIEQGFDLNVGGYTAGAPSWRGGYFQPNNNPQIDDARRGEYLPDYLCGKAVEFIEEHRDGPFYLQLSHYAVHVPLEAPDEQVARYRDKPPVGGHNNPTYAAMVEAVDRSVGGVLEALDRLGLAENTLVIFSSDNGGVGGYAAAGIEYREITDNAPLRGGKGTFYEGGIRVPLIVRWADRVEAGSVCHVPVISIDFYPTLLEAVGLAAPKDYPLDGVSLLPLLEEPDADIDRDALYWHFPGYLQGRGAGNWRTTPVSVIREGPWKLLNFHEGDRLELYHLEQDPGESTNLGESQPDEARRLRQTLHAWLRAMDAPMPQPRETPDGATAE